MSKITEFLLDTKTELKQVTWPKRIQTIYYTVAVLLLSIGLAYILGFFDFLFSKGLEKLISF